MNHREIILRCMEVNVKYMRLPAGMLDEYQALVKLYQRIASQCLGCAWAWMEDKPCPPHEPAVDAFVWAIVAWAEAFGSSIGVDMAEWNATFVHPHDQFASYLKPRSREETLSPVTGPPAKVVMELDVAWMNLGIKLTAKWGLPQHLKDRDALGEARKLEKGLLREGPVREAYLRSDLQFFNALFEVFPFSEKTREHLDAWILQLEEATL